MANEKPNRRLGRGLDALLRGSSSRGDAGAGVPAESAGGLKKISVASIRNNPYQPRKRFAAGQLKELEESIRVNGLLQPITVRKAADGNGYELVAGERRLRAMTNLGFKEAPAVVRDVDDQALLTFALIENLQRSDLDPVEEADGYARLIRDFALSQQAVADLVGKDRSTVANSLRILNLPKDVREMLSEGTITLGHAKALLGLSSQDKMTRLAREIGVRGLTVRDVERRIRGDAPPSQRKGRGKASAPTKPAAIAAIETQLRRRFQTDLSIEFGERGSGAVSIKFYSDSDLERILELMGIIIG
jgi:ParB family chromosome partitioning protein